MVQVVRLGKNELAEMKAWIREQRAEGCKGKFNSFNLYTFLFRKSSSFGNGVDYLDEGAPG
jgi:hypothetical protein